MPKKTTLPIEAHAHFRKANELHKYVTRDLAEATKHALETGHELLAAKQTIPHGSWESECTRLFDGSLRTAQFYMQFAKHMDALPKAQSSRILFLEETLEGAAKVAKRLAKCEDTQKLTVEQAPEPEEEIKETVSVGGAVVHDVLTHSPSPPPPFDSTEEFIEKPEKPKKNGPSKQYDRSFWLKQWETQIGPLVRLVDKIAHEVGEANSPLHERVQQHLEDATLEMTGWMQ